MAGRQQHFFAIGCSILLQLTIGCNTGNSDNNKTASANTFYYYPQKNVYYNPSNRSYHYSLDGGRNWDSIKVASAKQNETLGKREEITSETGNPWKDNAAHIRSYSGTGLALVGYNANGELAAEDVVSEKKVVTKPTYTVRKAIVEKTEKKGIGKLINNIFGKKKKKN
jgi:hypothetical protein